MAFSGPGPPRDSRFSDGQSSKYAFHYHKEETLKYLATKTFPLLPKDALESKQNLLETELTRKTYKERFHVLLYWEEHEHNEILHKRCNGKYSAQNFPREAHFILPGWFNVNRYQYLIAISGMTEDDIDYVKQAATHVTISSESCTCTGEVLNFDCYYKESPRLIVGFRQDSNIAQLLGGTPEVAVDVEFLLKHNYFENLHQSVECMQDPILAKLLPKVADFISYERKERLHKPTAYQFLLDSQYQFEALKRILFCSPRVPFLVTGPFGTGKTKLLATAAYMFLRGEENNLPDSKQCRVLLATHHRQTADCYLDRYFGPATEDGHLPGVDIIRLVWNKDTYKYSGRHKPLIGSINDIRSQITWYDLIITTLLTSLGLFSKCEVQPGYFTHILIDEAAQAREAEIAAVLSLANEHTKVIIAGDHLQVGPDTLVLGQKARDHGLGNSLLTRLHALYSSPDNKERAEPYTAKLLTNYRCHDSILKLPSELFYNSKLESRSKSNLHPKSRKNGEFKDGIVFQCTSLEQGNKFLSEESLISNAEQEADEIFNLVSKFCRPWPDEWRRENIRRICVLAPSKLQQRNIRKRFDNDKDLWKVTVAVAYDIQGREFRAVFLCTSEPVLSDGSTANPTKSICDKFVFNTVITRAQSLVVAVGNPFRLFQIEEKLPNGAGCWEAYIKHCISMDSLGVTRTALLHSKYRDVASLKKHLSSFLYNDEVQVSSDTEHEDSILTVYSEPKTFKTAKPFSYRRPYSQPKGHKKGRTQYLDVPPSTANLSGDRKYHKQHQKFKTTPGHGDVYEVNPGYSQSPLCLERFIPSADLNIACQKKRTWSEQDAYPDHEESLNHKVDDNLKLPDKEDLEEREAILIAPLNTENYKDKFHDLLYWEELEHEEILSERCNGTYKVSKYNYSYLPEWVNKDAFYSYLSIHGMSEDQMDYAKQASEGVFIDIKDSLSRPLQGKVLHIPREYDLVIGLIKTEHVIPIPSHFSVHAEVEFELKHSYFINLHRAINNLKEEMINKINPCEERFLCNDFKDNDTPKITARNLKQFHLSYEQSDSLKKALYSPPCVPFLVSGPFGTGKTRMLATAALLILRGCGFKSSQKPRVLLATHHLQTADSYLDLYFGPAVRSRDLIGSSVIRLISNTSYRYFGEYDKLFKMTQNITPKDINQSRLFISTLLTVPALMRKGSIVPGFFTHILIDEAAQVREPEAVAAFALADENTKIILAGDHLQVGPATLVLGEKAREYGLGLSILQRLHKLYNSDGIKEVAEDYSTELITNYRCHSGILRLPSHLFYKSTLQARSDSLLHPDTNQPIHFICTSFEEDLKIQSRNVNLKEQGEIEAKEILDAIKRYGWANSWPFHSEDRWSNVAVVAPSRFQERIIKRLIKLKEYKEIAGISVQVAFDIQGREFRAVFLCTSEPIQHNGIVANPTKSICDKFVFNTVITRAQSLVVAVGNPFRLLGTEERLENGASCWKAYIRHCLECKSLTLANSVSHNCATSSLKSLRERVLIKTSELVVTTSQLHSTNTGDSILQAYSKAVRKKKPMEYAALALRTVDGDASWTLLCSKKEKGAVLGKSDTPSLFSDSETIRCQLYQQTHRFCVAKPLDSKKSDIHIQGISNRQCAFDGAIVDVQLFHKNSSGHNYGKVVNIVEQGLVEQYVCRVDKHNPIFFFPLDRKTPKFVNLPQISRLGAKKLKESKKSNTEKKKKKYEPHDVVYFDPDSVKEGEVPKIRECIPLEIAVNMVFVVQPLNWCSDHRFPLGVVVGVLPRGDTMFHAERILQVQYQIAKNEESCDNIEINNCETSPHKCDKWRMAFTIDPREAKNLDDALSLSVLEKTADYIIFEFAVHIVNAGRLLPKERRIEDCLHSRCTSIYGKCQGEYRFTPMLPEHITCQLSLNANQERQAITVSGKARLKLSNGVIDFKFPDPQVEIKESVVCSLIALTYEQAECLLYSNQESPPIQEAAKEKLKLYNCSKSAESFPLDEQLKILLMIAKALRLTRLGESGHMYDPSDPTCLSTPCSHMLVEEMMIWGNSEVAKKLFHSSIPSILLRIQPNPKDDELENFCTNFSSFLCASLRYASEQYQRCMARVEEKIHPSFLLMHDTKKELIDKLNEKDLQGVLNLLSGEHIYPQLAVMSRHNASMKSKASYKAIDDRSNVSAEEVKQKYGHYDLNVLYTQFSSPLRRAPDVIVQRLLLDAIYDSRDASYSHEELKKLSQTFNGKIRNASSFERALTALDIAIYAGRSSICTTAFISGISKTKIELLFQNLDLKKLPKRQMTLPSTVLLPHTSHKHRQWKVLVATFFKDDCVMDVTQYTELVHCDRRVKAKPNHETKASMFTCTADHDSKNSGTFERKTLLFCHKSLLTIVPMSFRIAANEFIRSPSAESSEKMLSTLSNPIDSETDFNMAPHIEDANCIFDDDSDLDYSVSSEKNQLHASEESDDEDIENHLAKSKDASQTTVSVTKEDFSTQSLLKKASFAFLEIPFSLQLFDPLKIWMTFDSREFILTPMIQLVEIAPNLNVCTQHLSSPAICFSPNAIQMASSDVYEDIEQYKNLWEGVLLPEGAASSFKSISENSRLVIIRNVLLQWPRLEIPSNAVDDPYYVVEQKNFITLQLPDGFTEDLNAYIELRPGCLLCVRYIIKLEEDETKLLFSLAKRMGFVKDTDGTEDALKRLLGPHSDGYIRAVYHMVIRETSDQKEEHKKPLKLKVKFLGGGGHNVSVVMKEFLSQEKYKCNIEVTEMSIPDMRVYSSLVGLKEDFIASDIALVRKDKSRTVRKDNWKIVENDKNVLKLWNNPGSKMINEEQREALKRSMQAPFTMIQGPPGTGKSVTGAHLAYAFALVNKQRNSSGIKPPCVLYCGPSNKSVEVVLKMLLPMKNNIKLLMVYSRTIESNDTQPIFDRKLLGYPKHEHKCPEELQEFALHHLIRKSRYREKIKAIEENLQRLRKEGFEPSGKAIRKWKKVIEKSEKEIMGKGYDIVFCTCNEAGSGRIPRSLSPIQCIIDEAAMATEPECMVPISISEHVVLIGDHQQLQPIIEHRESKENGLECSLFERYALKIDDPPLIKLTKQYRMNESVCSFPSEQFYDGDLVADESLRGRVSKVENLKNFWPSKKQRIVFCDVEDTGQRAEKETAVGTHSQSNHTEAFKVVQIVETLINKYKIETKELAVLTPYKDQKILIRKLLEEKRIVDISVRTITESQGSEFGLVVLSTVRSLPIKDIQDEEAVQADRQWILENLGFVTDPHQVCVGITRSKYGLIIVGNRVLLNYDKLTWSELLNHYRKKNCIVDGAKFPLK